MAICIEEKFGNFFARFFLFVRRFVRIMFGTISCDGKADDGKKKYVDSYKKTRQTNIQTKSVSLTSFYCFCLLFFSW